MNIAKTTLNRLKKSPDAALYLIAAAEVAAAFCIAAMCKTDAVVRLAAAWEGLDLIIRNGQIVGLNR